MKTTICTELDKLKQMLDYARCFSSHKVEHRAKEVENHIRTCPTCSKNIIITTFANGQKYYKKPIDKQTNII